MPVDLDEYYNANKPKTDQLNADDLLTCSITVTIEDANNSKAEGPLALSISGGWKPYKPCFTMRKLLGFVWNDQNPNAWVGKSLTLYRDPDVKNRGEVVGGIRISHVSHIAAPKTCKLTETRGTRKAWTVLPLAASDVKTSRPTQPDVPPEIAAVLNEWRSRLTSENKTLTAMAKRIAAVRTPEQSLAIEADLSSIEDHDARILLTDFLTAILAALA